MQESAAVRTPRHHVRLKGGPCVSKVLHSYSQLLYTSHEPVHGAPARG